MINLLPPELKSAYSFGRRNVVLRHWIVVGLIILLGLGLISTYGLLTFKQSTDNSNGQISSAQNQLQKDNLDKTKAETQDVSNSLKLSVKVLSSEVLFSKLIGQIGAVMPDGAVLSNLIIDKSLNGINLTADTTDYNTATQIQVNLTDPSNKIFSKVDIISIVCQGNSGAYPCTATFRGQFNAHNQFLFVNQGTKP